MPTPRPGAAPASHLGRRNARFQQWRALADNRAKRHHSASFLVTGVRPITLAVNAGWPLRTLLVRDDPAPRSAWAEHTIAELRATGTEIIAVAPDLLAELGDREPGHSHQAGSPIEATPELLAIAALPEDRPERIPATDTPAPLIVVFDRPTNPGNLGTLVRSADAFGATGLVVTGHAADPYDPRAVRASTGSLFALPVVRAEGHRPVLDWLDTLGDAGVVCQVIGTDETGTHDIGGCELTGPTVLVIGNETAGMSAGWRQACDAVARIPIGGAASSLNAAAAATVVLYETARQRRAATGGGAQVTNR
jgi:TrmH family RNA methyltransferase